jgi:hypothetical protein
VFAGLRMNHPKINQNGYAILFLLFYLCSVWPFFSLKYVPFHDLAQHLAAGAGIKDLLFGGPLVANYRIDIFFPYILMWLVIASLNVFFDILLVSKLLVFIYFLVAPLSVYYYLDEDKKGLSLISFLFFNSNAFNMGMINYAFSIPLLFFSLGAYKKGSRLFYPLSFLLFTDHPATYGLCVFILLVFCFSSGKKQKQKILYSLSLLFLFIVMLLISVSTYRSSGDDQNPDSIFNTSLQKQMIYGVIGNFTYTFFNGFQFFRPDYIGLLGFAIVSVFYAKQLFLRKNFDRKILFIVLSLLTVMVFLPPNLPLGKGLWNTFSGRFLPIAALLMLTDLRLSKNAEKAALLLFLVLVFVNSLTLFAPYAEANKRLIDYYEPVLEQLPSGKKIYVIEETKMVPGYIFTSSHTYGQSPYTNFFPGYYSIKGGFSSQYFGSGLYSTTWPLNYTTTTYYPMCYNNISSNCHLCDNRGMECDYAEHGNYSLYPNNSIYCVNCTRPMALVCNQLSEENNFIDTGSCIPCEIKNLSCILQNWLVRENFDYVVAFSTSDDIGDYLINGTDPYLKNQDVLVYRIK